jgi:hypothetical protein
MRNSLETTVDLLKETVNLRVEYDYRDDDNISILDVEMYRAARECALYWSWESWVRVDLSEILSYAQQDTIKAQIIEHEATIHQWRQESA